MKLLWALAVLGLAASSGCAMAAPPAPPARSTFEQSVSTKILKAPDNGTEYRIDVRLPPGYEQSKGPLPVVYVLDGNLMLGTAIEYVGVSEFTHELPNTIVVGIGYKDPSIASVIGQRVRDMTLENNEAVYARARAADPNLPPSRGSGGAERFSRHLRELILPYVRTHFRIDPKREVLFGDSLAGGLAAYVLLSHPNAFSAYVLGSPAIVQADNLLFKMEARYAQHHRDLPVRVFMSVGSREAPDMLSGMQDMAARLRSRNYPSLKLTTRVFEDETHTMALSRNFAHGLRAVLCSNFEQGKC